MMLSSEGAELQILGILIDEYEKKIPYRCSITGLKAIKFRLDKLIMKQKDLAIILGSKSRAGEILFGKRSLSLLQIKNFVSKAWNPCRNINIGARSGYITSNSC
jgi:HTH-type transcriptional regulator/antitoxin HigA